MWFDSFIGFFSPKAQLKREQSRLAMKHLRNYDAAGRGRRWKNSKSGGLSVNAENARGKKTVRERARDTIRNNPYAQKAAHSLPANIVGRGIVPAIPQDQQIIRDNWRRWAETTECDYDGQLNFYAMQNLIMRTVVESGECLIRRRRVRRSDSTLGIKLQVLEPDFIDDTVALSTSKTSRGAKIIDGIEFDAQGRRIAYHLYESHPGNNGVDLKLKSQFISKPIPASEIIHVYRLDRPGQVRGISWFHASMLRLKELDEYEDAQLMRQKIAACYAAFIRDIDGSSEPTQAEADTIEKFSPGMIEQLGPGKTIELANPPQVNESYDAYISTMLHGVAAGLNMSYETLTGDLSKVNFSSARMGWLEFQRNIELWRNSIMVGQCCNQVWSWFAEALSVQEQSIEDVGLVSWTSPRREMIDPTKEVPAKIKEIRAGLTTLSDAIRERGNNPRDQLAEYKADNDLLDELGLKLDTDARIEANEQSEQNGSSEATQTQSRD